MFSFEIISVLSHLHWATEFPRLKILHVQNRTLDSSVSHDFGAVGTPATSASQRSGARKKVHWWWSTMRNQKMAIKTCSWMYLIRLRFWRAWRRSTALNLSFRSTPSSFQTEQYKVGLWSCFDFCVFARHCTLCSLYPILVLPKNCWSNALYFVG